MGEAKPLQASERKQGRIDFARFRLAKAGFDLAAQQCRLDVGAKAPNHGGASQRGGSDDGAFRQIGDALCFRGNQRVSNVLPRQVTADCQSVGQQGR